jgi:hypothetical protein
MIHREHISSIKYDRKNPYFANVGKSLAGESGYFPSTPISEANFEGVGGVKSPVNFRNYNQRNEMNNQHSSLVSNSIRTNLTGFCSDLTSSLVFEANLLINKVNFYLDQDEVDEAFDILFEKMDKWQTDEKWKQVRVTFQLIAQIDLPLKVLIGFLVSSLANRDNLGSERNDLYEFAKRKAFEIGGEAKFNATLQGLG